MTVALGEEEMGERHALAGGPQARTAQKLGDVGERRLGWQAVCPVRRLLHLD
jgi:hypothetical protein